MREKKNIMMPFRFTPEVRQKLEEIAEIDRRSMTEEINYLIEKRWLELNKKSVT